MREDFAIDIDFLSEEEGYQRFLTKDDVGANQSNLVLADGYCVNLPNFVEHPNNPIDGYLLYFIDGSLYSRGSVGLPSRIGIQVASDEIVPTIKAGTTTMSTDFAVAAYSRIESIVTVNINIQFTKSGSGDIIIQGLPSPAKNTANLIQGLTVLEYKGITPPALYGRTSTIQAVIFPNEDVIRLQVAAGNDNRNITTSDVTLDDGALIRISGTYISN
jgi:hypothetical protein